MSTCKYIKKQLKQNIMILTDKRILEEMEKGTIKIEPYSREDLGSNSYDVHLGKTLAVYEGYDPFTMELITNKISLEDYIKKMHGNVAFAYSKTSPKMDMVAQFLVSKFEHEPILDAAQHNKIIQFDIPEEGLILYKEVFYLGATAEYTETHAHVPFLEGKSSTGRLSMDIHATAGKGDVGFCGNWTLEISVKNHLRVYAGMPVGQLIYFPVDGDVDIKYNDKQNAKYAGQSNLPTESMMWKNPFFQKHQR